MTGKPYKMRNKYYCRLYKPIGGGKYHQILVPLKTSNKLEANRRMIFVRQAEAAILLGDKVTFPWQNGTNKVAIKNYTVKNAVKDYIKYKQSERLKDTSIVRIEIALNHFINILGRNYSVTNITIKHIDSFKRYFTNTVRHSPTTLNSNLTIVNTFVVWLYDRNKISAIPKIVKVKVRKKLPLYVNDEEWEKIMALDYLYIKNSGHKVKFDEHWKRAFYFYKTIGCRLSEPFNGKLSGNWLVIEPENSKTNRQREIFIPDELIDTLKEMQSRINNSISTNKRHCIISYSKKFKNACDTIGIDKYFHCLRHTYAVRRYLQTQDIYLVAKELGHSTVKTTEIYANFNIRRLKQDFPSIFVSKKLPNNTNNHIESYTNHRIQLAGIHTTIVGNV